MFAIETSVLTDEGFVPVDELNPGDSLLSPLTEEPTKIARILRRSLVIGGRSRHRFVTLPAASVTRSAPDRTTLLWAYQPVFEIQSSRYAQTCHAHALSGARPVSDRCTVDMCLLVFEKPALFCANGLVLESTADLTNQTKPRPNPEKDQKNQRPPLNPGRFETSPTG